MQRTSLKFRGRRASREVKRKPYLCNGRAIDDFNLAIKKLCFGDERIGPSTRHLREDSSSPDDPGVVHDTKDKFARTPDRGAKAPLVCRATQKVTLPLAIFGKAAFE